MPIPAEYETVGDLRRAAKDIAEAVLEEYWGTDRFPVDPVVIARDLGVEVFSAELGNDVFGMLVGSDSGGSRIYLDRDQPEKRHRFTAAHELGHYIDRSSRLTQGVTFIDRRSDEGRGTPDEIYANEFAGNLLMPARTLRAFLDAGRSRLQIAETFGVSLSALSYRMSVLGW